MLTHGVLLGIGSSFCFFPAVLIVNQWFAKYRGLATGIASAGTGIGGILFTILTQYLITEWQIQWALRIIAAITMGVLALAVALMETRFPPSPSSARKFDPTVFKDFKFMLLFSTSILGVIGFLMPVHYIPCKLVYNSILRDDEKRTNRIATTQQRTLMRLVLRQTVDVLVRFSCRFTTDQVRWDAFSLVYLQTRWSVR
jgi:MFS family permease